MSAASRDIHLAREFATSERLIHQEGVSSGYRKWIYFVSGCTCNWVQFFKAEELFKSTYINVYETKIEFNYPAYNCCYSDFDNVAMLYYDRVYFETPQISSCCCTSACCCCTKPFVMLPFLVDADRLAHFVQDAKNAADKRVSQGLRPAMGGPGAQPPMQQQMGPPMQQPAMQGPPMQPGPVNYGQPYYQQPPPP
eukprot:Cvel_13645.t1-p1 / transcript=Cvel_13645.t1 / gene=Cvel_13645 / organism=Chromera_velia_CCMP2878 / gene_product=hypothetical protein / transcript_product=hypothetical protein / location=Cvel_scaffold941:3185-6265(-) / protein_length=194 / sequence_SO=supercontig / SO=protein_coding / is_pseudo=false